MGVPADLLVVTCEALEAAESELGSLSDPEVPWPLPDDVTQALDIGEVLAHVLQRVYDATTDDGRRRIDAMVAEEAYRVSPLDGGTIPVMPSVLEALAEARETVRRRALSDPDTAAALRDVADRGWAW